MPWYNKAPRLEPPSASTPAIRPAGTAAVTRRAALACALFLLIVPEPKAIELCSDRSRELMRSVGIRSEQIERLCELAAEAGRLTRLSIRRAEDEAGYCRVTLALRNDSIHHINSFSLTTSNGRFDIFQFYDILPGGTGYASAPSRQLMSCEELPELKVVLRWPGTVRADDRPLQGRLLDQFKPALMSKDLKWIE
jgi:hypothetical protein